MSVQTQIGRILAGKYRLDRVLGTGGMGTVVAATHLGLGRKVALKFMSLGLVDDAESVSRFTREARAAAALRGEHVARVMDVEIDGKNGAPYIVMEYLEGSDLATVLESRGRLPPLEAVGHVLQVCEGLAEAHANGIIHRDIKPANLFLTRRPDGRPLVKVLDFGVSKLNEFGPSGSFHLTGPRRALGSPNYMSPEQMIASPEVDQRADIWALGVILYELIAGERPFVAPSFLELSLEVTNRAPPPLGGRVPGLAPGLVAVVERCLQKTPAARFSDVAKLAAALVPHAGPGADAAAARIARTLGTSERTLELTPAPAPLAGPTPPAVGDRPGSPVAATRWRLMALAAIALAIVATAAVVIGRRAPLAAPERASSEPAPVPAITAKPAAPAAAPAQPAARVIRPAPPTPRPHRRRAAPPAPRSAPDHPAAKPPVDDSATRTKHGPVIIEL